MNILRFPDDIKIQTDASPFRFEEPGVANPTDARVECSVSDGVLRVTLLPSGDAVRFLRLRFRGDMSQVRQVLGDAFQRVRSVDARWHVLIPHESMPWYFYAWDGEHLDCYGVKTGAGSFVYWNCDVSGITLLLDVRCGSDGVRITEPLLCAEIVTMRSKDGEDPFAAAGRFCSIMCEKPNLPEEPVYGYNNWYWSYGITSKEAFLREAVQLGKMTSDLPVRPYMVMDDGWQVVHCRGYHNGGPWFTGNERFGDMKDVADKTRAAGCKPGIWYRPLRTLLDIPEEAQYKSPAENEKGLCMDPTHPFTLETVRLDVERFRDWGYGMIKHDFTTIDLLNHSPSIHQAGMHFYRRDLTSAQALKQLYRTIQDAAGDIVVVGCNTVNHLGAGIHAMQRVGDDTSGRCFEWTRQCGVHSLMRLPQSGRFGVVDPDCAAFTDKVSHKLNLDFLEASAITGCATIASVTPGTLTDAEETRLHDIFEIAATVKPGQYAHCDDWMYSFEPARFTFRGKQYFYDWYSEHEGARLIYSWMQ